MKKLFAVALSLCAASLFAATAVTRPTESQPNASVVFESSPPADISLISIQPQGPHDVVVMERGTPAFFRNCVAGAHYKTVTIVMRKAGGDFLKFTLHRVFVSSYSLGVKNVATVHMQYEFADGSVRPYQDASAPLVNPNTTAAPDTAQLVVDGVPGQRFELLGLTLLGNNTAAVKLREPANGFFQTAAANKQKASSLNFLVFRFKLVAVKTISWAHDDEGPTETVTFEYGSYDGPTGGYRR